MEWCTMLFNKVLENFAVYLGQCDVFACNLITNCFVLLDLHTQTGARLPTMYK